MCIASMSDKKDKANLYRLFIDPYIRLYHDVMETTGRKFSRKNLEEGTTDLTGGDWLELLSRAYEAYSKPDSRVSDSLVWLLIPSI